MGCLLKANGLYSRTTIGAVLLAAGAGSRLGGRPKALLELGGVPLVMRQLVALSGAGVDEVVGRARPSRRRDRGARSQQFPITIVRNPSPDDGQASSVRIGLQRAVATTRRGDRRAGRPAADRRAGHRRADRRLQETRRRRRWWCRACVEAASPGNPVMFDAALRDEWLAGDGRCRVPQVARRAPGARALVRHRQPALPHRHRHARRPRALHARPPAIRCSGRRTLARGGGRSERPRVALRLSARARAAPGRC